MVLDSEDPPRTPPEGIKEKLDEYNRLQTEDPAKAQAMLAEFMSDESVVAGLAKPVVFGDDQIASAVLGLVQEPVAALEIEQVRVVGPARERPVGGQVPLDRLLIETDSPYLAPVPFRGKPNEPRHVAKVAETIAALRDMSVEDLAQQSRDNYYRLFGKPAI